MEREQLEQKVNEKIRSSIMQQFELRQPQTQEPEHGGETVEEGWGKGIAAGLATLVASTITGAAAGFLAGGPLLAVPGAFLGQVVGIFAGVKNTVAVAKSSDLKSMQKLFLDLERVVKERDTILNATSNMPNEEEAESFLRANEKKVVKLTKRQQEIGDRLHRLLLKSTTSEVLATMPSATRDRTLEVVQGARAGSLTAESNIASKVI